MRHQLRGRLTAPVAVSALALVVGLVGAPPAAAGPPPAHTASTQGDAVPNLICSDCGPISGNDGSSIRCMPTIEVHTLARGTDLESGEGFTRIKWTAREDCASTSSLVHSWIDGESLVYDRTGGFDGDILGRGGTVTGNDHVTSTGDIRVWDSEIPEGAGVEIEIVFEKTMTITGPTTIKWEACKPIDPLRYVDQCQGLGTKTLTNKVGTRNKPTGKAARCQSRSEQSPQLESRVTSEHGALLALPIVIVSHCVNLDAFKVYAAKLIVVAENPQESALDGKAHFPLGTQFQPRDEVINGQVRRSGHRTTGTSTTSCNGTSPTPATRGSRPVVRSTSSRSASRSSHRARAPGST